jgi:3'-phosphoadenosine 5'-phosphosulfate sulfotransferase (PAPS reductase)/FAD synthetase
MISKERLTHLRQLEAESVYILREVAAAFANPVMMYSVGKDSSVMLHLAMKAFAPSKLPFPLLHVDTTWKFKEMISFRDQRAKDLGFDLSEVRVVMKRSLVQKSVSSHFATNTIDGIPRTNARSFGMSTIQPLKKVRVYAFFLSLTGQSLIFGNTSTLKR